MKHGKRLAGWLIFLISVLLSFSSFTKAEALKGTPVDGICTGFKLEDIPVGEMGAPQHPFPEEPYSYISQHYNTEFYDGVCSPDGVNSAALLNPECGGKKNVLTDNNVDYYCMVKGEKKPALNPVCEGKNPMFRHNGLDIRSKKLQGPGIGKVFPLYRGKVIVSRLEVGGTLKNWGETIVIATRPSQYSEEILTVHYHHLHRSVENGKIQTSRKVYACEEVETSQEIAREGKTGDWPTHLHVTIRRWNSLKEMSDAISPNIHKLYSGYAPSWAPHDHTDNLKQHLSPRETIYQTFLDSKATDWHFNFVSQMRNLGIEEGLFDGRYGVGQDVTREEAVRWLKIGAKQLNKMGLAPTFDDVTWLQNVNAVPYVETMTRYPSKTLPVINPNPAPLACVSGGSVGKNFCPHDKVLRSQALKMVILTFYYDWFRELYLDELWNADPAKALAKVSQFEDVDPYDWYAPYAYFARKNGFIVDNAKFRPNDPVKREEMAKFVVNGVYYLVGASPSCSGPCASGYFCSPSDGKCKPLPPEYVCAPSETEQCPYGGGLEESAICGDGACTGTENQSNCCIDCGNCPACNNGQTMNCGLCGISTCSNGLWGACMNQGVCSPGQSQSQSCNGNGTQSRTCNNSCQWGPWGSCMSNCQCASGVCCDGCNYLSSSTVCDQWYNYQCQGPNPGQDAQQALMQQYCSGSSSICNGSVQQGSWQTYDNCSSSEVCQMSGGTAGCVPAPCTDVYLASSLSSCYSNPQGSGSPTLCLEVQQNSGASWQYRVCKQGGSFGNNFTYHLQDDNYSNLWSDYSGSQGATCSSWKTADVSYINGYGAANGAGLMIYLTSPTGCNQAACQYRTGSITIRKECQ